MFRSGWWRSSPAPLLRRHVIYGFANGVWLSVDATWYGGGRTTVNGVLNDDLQQNWRLGSTLAFPIDRDFSIKLYASTGVSDRTGNSYDLLGLVLQYRWLQDVRRGQCGGDHVGISQPQIFGRQNSICGRSRSRRSVAMRAGSHA